MRKITTIAFLLLLIVAQYTRQLSYVGCKLFATAQKDCGCESILSKNNLDTNDGNHTSNNVVHKHLQIDDFVSNIPHTYLQKLLPKVSNNKFGKYKVTLLIGISAALLKPPIV